MAIVRKILTEGQIAIDNYFKFLASGGSDGPIELLKIAGVDLTKEQAFQLAFKEFEDALNEYIKL